MALLTGSDECNALPLRCYSWSFSGVELLNLLLSDTVYYLQHLVVSPGVPFKGLHTVGKYVFERSTFPTSAYVVA